MQNQFRKENVNQLVVSKAQLNPEREKEQLTQFVQLHNHKK